MTLWHAFIRRWKEGKRDELARYLQRYRRRRERLDGKQIKARTEYDALRAELDGQVDKAQTIRAGGLALRQTNNGHGGSR